MNKYWLCRFSNYTFKKWELEEGQSIDEAIKRYLHSQNVGEAKSDRIHFYEKQLISKDEFDKHFADKMKY